MIKKESEDRLAVLKGREETRAEMKRDGTSEAVQKSMERFWAKLDAIAAKNKHWKGRVR